MSFIIIISYTNINIIQNIFQIVYSIRLHRIKNTFQDKIKYIYNYICTYTQGIFTIIGVFVSEIS